MDRAMRLSIERFLLFAFALALAWVLAGALHGEARDIGIAALAGQQTVEAV